MSVTPSLIFDIGGSLYALPATDAREIILLPELTPLAEAPPAIVGVFNLRGQVVPVIDLRMALGLQVTGFRLEDSVIVLANGDSCVGIVVNAVLDVTLLSTEATEPVPHTAGMNASRFVSGLAKTPEAVIMLLQMESLLQAATQSAVPTAPAAGVFWPEASGAQRAVLRERAANLRQRTTTEDRVGLVPVAVVGLNGEYFGVDLELVREFGAISNLTPVPCCPPHILGQMNLRGDIVTLVDLRSALHMELANINRGRVMVVQSSEVPVGVRVDEVYDVVYLQPSMVNVVPTAVQTVRDDYLKGTAPYADRMMCLLDLQRILADEDLVVSEEM